jgi:hypothetical protein
MTDEEINELIKEQSKEIEQWSISKGELSNQDKRHINILLLKKETLEKLKAAREKGRYHQEFSLTITYGLLSSIGEKYPFLIPLIKSKSSLL